MAKKQRGFKEDNDFRSYMSRKIDLQRKQFGAKPPPENCVGSSSNIADVDCDRDNGDDTNSSASTCAKLNVQKNSYGFLDVVNRLKRRHGVSSPDNEMKSPKITYDNQENNVLIISEKKKKKRTDLFFTGVVILVNGYTKPDANTLMRMMHKHGGDLEKYETHRITHIIAEHLSTAKALIYRKRKNPTPVCLPKWICDCVERGRLIPHANYILEEVRNTNVGDGIKSFLTTFATSNAHPSPSLSPTPKNNDPLVSCHERCTSPMKISKNQKSIVRFSETVRVAYFDGAVSVSVSNSGSKSKIASGTCHINDLTSEFDNKISSEITKRLDFEEENSNDEKERQKSASCIFNSTPHMNNVIFDNKIRTVVTKNSEFEEEDDTFEKELQKSTSCSTSTSSRTYHNNTSNCASDKNNLNVENKAINEVKERIDLEKKIVTDENELHKSTSCSTSSSATPKNKIIRTVGTDPNFLQSYFSTSRLSFIGRFKQRTKKNTEQTSTKTALLDPNSIYEKIIFHIDMDCFFVSVALRSHPEHMDKPVAVGHGHKRSFSSSAKKSTSELSTCNYIARKRGVMKGMWLEQALALCPDLIVLPYDYEGYEEVSLLVSEILHKCAEDRSGIIEQESCDEFYAELSFSGLNSKDEVTQYASSIAEDLRRDIYDATQCTASVGVGSNKFLAKLATDKAKPNGSYVIQNWEKELGDLKLLDLPGIGRKLQRKLDSKNITTVQDVWDLGADAESDLTNILGPGIAKKVLHLCQGEDNSPVSGKLRKTVGAECNYGVRFDGPYGVDHMMSGLAQEVDKRMEHLDVKGSFITLKIKRRKETWNVEKFLGHGPCYNLSKSCDLPGRLPTRDSAIFSKYGMKLFVELGVDKDDVKGMGIVISKLDLKEKNNGTSKLSSWFKSDTENQNAESQTVIEILDDNSESNNSSTSKIVNSKYNHGQNSTEVSLPSMSQIDWNEVSMLPGDIQNEILQELNSASTINLDQSKQNQVSNKSRKKTRSRAFKPSKAGKLSKKPLLNNNNDEQRRQLNVEHMLKLANVKAGHRVLTDNVGESVSLTQLEELPFELQLQIANSDIGTDISNNLITSRGEDDEVEVIGHTLQHDDPNEGDSHADFVHQEVDCGEDIMVLNKWMTCCISPTSDDVSRVHDFFNICLAEHRLDDVIAMLRSIRNRDDEWKNYFSRLVSAVSNTYFSQSKRRLDLKWLDLE